MNERAVEILLVEDDPADAELTLRALKENNLANEVLHVTDGAEALDYLFGTGRFHGRDALNTPKVVFLDLKLPKVSGIDVLKRLRTDERTKTVPVVVLTSSREERDLIDTYELGVNSYIVKPVDFDQFTTAVREIGLYWLLLNKTPARGE
jgi:two-component system, response regulator